MCRRTVSRKAAIRVHRVAIMDAVDMSSFPRFGHSSGGDDLAILGGQKRFVTSKI